ncbi:uncharacterized protein LOC122280024 isoform X2 [Carya illinoinensis]|uniref:uncharacterized protein LOC122280024 isoform X2 n=1 Tax=Carya illinoinensis TaxID=32201 RepID=UPI001C720072|nr:uncharacterized protein LOC122280024 isoform X2 [Carya illinoinensis]
MSPSTSISTTAACILLLATLVKAVARHSQPSSIAQCSSPLHDVLCLGKLMQVLLPCKLMPPLVIFSAKPCIVFLPAFIPLASVGMIFYGKQSM